LKAWASVYQTYAFLNKSFLKISVSISIFLFSISLFGNNEESTFIELSYSSQYEKARQYLLTFNDISFKQELEKHLDILQYGKFENINLYYDTESLKDTNLKAIILINQSLKFYLKNGEEIKAYQLLKKSLTISENNKNNALVSLSSRLILEIYSRSTLSVNDISYQYIVNNYLKHAKNTFEIKSAYLYDFKITMRFHYKDSSEVIIEKYKQVNQLFKADSLSFSKAKLYLNNSSFHNRISKNLDSCLYYLNNAEKSFKTSLGYFEKEKYIALKIIKSSVFFEKKEYQKSLSILNSIELDTSDYLYKILDSYINYHKFQNYKQLKDASKALKFQNKYLSQQLLQNHSNNIQVVSQYETKYETEKREKENIKLKTDIEKEQRQKRNLWIGSITLLIFGSSLAFLIQKNTKRKQKLAEQEKELETQKLATVLKEQELTAIDAMIEGQEKERQRIANDLHDDLGGLMATVKLHFNALKDKQTPELYTKTNTLIDEAYHKIRTVAHAKNSGVIAKQGLLKAINEMADKISASNKLVIEVIDHGLENRLENSLELTIFRIIQELITNVIKHANSTEVSVHITNHEDSLNIMVEDNGKGFNPSQITKTNKGMGISSIDKRIAHLNGTMTIESEIKKGTTIIIDLPL